MDTGRLPDSGRWCPGHLLSFTGESSHSFLLDLILDLTDQLPVVLCRAVQKQISLISKTAVHSASMHSQQTAAGHFKVGFLALAGVMLLDAAMGFVFPCEEWQRRYIDCFLTDRMHQDISGGESSPSSQ